MFLNALPLAVELATLLLTLAGLFYLSLALLAIRSFRRQPRPAAPAVLPTLSILKPVKGFDPGLLNALRSHCRQTYAGRFELLLGASGDAAELSALETMVAQLHLEFPATAIRVIACPERLGTNGKVSTLLQMLPHALGNVLVINDADIRVSLDYLAHLTAWLAQPNVGLVTAPYFAQVATRGGVWSRLEALGISTEFFPSVLVARMMERGVRFGLGSTLALRRDTLDRIGGLEPLVELLADDYELGARTAAAGMRVVLANEPVATSVPPYSLRGFALHQTRWYRTVRDARRLGYLGMVTTYALPWAMATVVASGGALWSVSLLSLTLLLRVAVALSGGVGVLQDGQVLRDLMLLPVRDTASLLFWAWSFAGNTVLWRGERFHVQNGRLVRRMDRREETAIAESRIDLSDRIAEVEPATDSVEVAAIEEDVTEPVETTGIVEDPIGSDNQDGVIADLTEPDTESSEGPGDPDTTKEVVEPQRTFDDPMGSVEPASDPDLEDEISTRSSGEWKISVADVHEHSERPAAQPRIDRHMDRDRYINQAKPKAPTAQSRLSRSVVTALPTVANVALLLLVVHLVKMKRREQKMQRSA